MLIWQSQGIFQSLCSIVSTRKQLHYYFWHSPMSQHKPYQKEKPLLGRKTDDRILKSQYETGAKLQKIKEI